MEENKKMNKFTDRERLEYVKEYKASGLSVKEFSESRGISRTTMRDWINAFESITGGFIKIDAQLKGEGDIAKNVYVNSRHFDSTTY